MTIMNNIFQLPIENEIPFSFKYGGRLFQHLLPAWDFLREPPTLFWADPETGLGVMADVTTHETGAVEWQLTFTNTGTKPTLILQDVWAVSVIIPGNRGWRESAWVHQLNKGSLCKEDDWLPTVTEMIPGSLLKFSPLNGHSSSGACPFFNVEWEGGGVITAIGWTGQWRAEIAWGTKTEIRAGVERIHLSLMPGESICGPSIMQLYWEGDIEDSYNQFRKTMLDHVYPRSYGVVVEPPIAHLSTAGYEWNWGTEDDVLSHLEAVKDLGFETLWMDAYYFKGGFPRGQGNHRHPEFWCAHSAAADGLVDEKRFPRGLGFIGDKVHEADMEWLVWVGIEDVRPNTWLDQDHPEWLLSAEGHSSKLFNFGNEEARAWMADYLVWMVRRFKMDWLRLDCCPGTKPYWHEADRDRGRIGMTEIRWVEGLYWVLDHVLETYPNLKIDNCDGGGRRIDLEMCKRSIPLWRTDFTTPTIERGDPNRGAMLTQTTIAGLSRYVPLNSCGGFSEEPYWFRSAFNGGIGVLEDCRPEFYPRERMTAAIEEAKRIREYFHGNLYFLTEVVIDPAAWHAFQYHLPDEDRGIAMIFRRHDCTDDCIDICLREIKEWALYSVNVWDDYDSVTTSTLSGRDLKHMHLKCRDQPGSLLLEYRGPQ